MNLYLAYARLHHWAKTEGLHALVGFYAERMRCYR